MRDYQLRSDRDLLRRAFDAGIRPTGSAIARAAGIPAGTVNAVRQGRPPRVQTMLTLADMLGCTVDDLFHVVEFDAGPMPEPSGFEPADAKQIDMRPAS